ncbi:MAG: hypothetical protein IKA78_06250 [Oscillospiraceae bacterium]|nr:hypothetical protein [Oscillospiraceae bacterium]
MPKQKLFTDIASLLVAYLTSPYTELVFVLRAIDNRLLWVRTAGGADLRKFEIRAMEEYTGNKKQCRVADGAERGGAYAA